VLDGGAHWRNLTNTIEPSMCGGDAVFLSNYFDHLFAKERVEVNYFVDRYWLLPFTSSHTLHLRFNYCSQ